MNKCTFRKLGKYILQCVKMSVNCEMNYFETVEPAFARWQSLILTFELIGYERYVANICLRWELHWGSNFGSETLANLSLLTHLDLWTHELCKMWLDFRSLIRRSWRRSLIRVGARLVRLWRGGMRLWLGCILTPNPAQLTGWWRLSCPALVSHVISQRRQRPFCRQWHRDRPSVAPLPLQRIKFRIFGEVCEADLYLKYHIFQRAAQGAQRKLSYSPFPVAIFRLENI